MRIVSALLLVTLVPLPAAASAEDLRLLGDAPIYGLLRPRTAYRLIGDARVALAERRLLGRPLFEMFVGQLSAVLGFDPTRRQGLEKIGIDADQPLLLALGAHDPQRVAAANAHARRGPAPKGRGRRVQGRPDDGPLALLGQRLVARVADAKRLRRYLGGRTVSLQGGAAAAGERLAGLLRVPSSSPGLAELAAALLKREVQAVARPDRRSLICVRLLGQRLVVDLLLAWQGSLSVGGLAPRVAERLKPGGGPAGPLAKRAFSGKPGAAALLRAPALRRLAELGRQRDLARRGGLRGKRGRGARRCEAGWRAIGRLTGDAAGRLGGTGRHWRAQVWWQASASLVAAFARGRGQRPRIDPSAYADAVAMGATNFDLAAVARAQSRLLGRWGAAFDELVDRCGELAVVGLATGGWLALPGMLYAEVGRDKNIAPLRDHVRHVVGAARTGASGVVELVVGGLPPRRARALLTRLPGVGSEADRIKTAGGGEASLHRYRGWQLGIRRLRAEHVGAALGSLADLRWFFGRPRADAPVIPGSILAYAQAELPKILPVSPATAARLAKRLGRLGANLSVDGRVISLELRMKGK